jgi:hypothetical protein
MKNLECMEKSIDKLIEEFNKQVVSMDDNKEFHNTIINLSSKYPEHKELLEFIVMVNDKIETRQSIFSDMIIDSFNELMRIKKEVLIKMIEKERIENEKKLFAKLTNLKASDYKTILFFIAIIIFGAAILLYPDIALKAITKI